MEQQLRTLRHFVSFSHTDLLTNRKSGSGRLWTEADDCEIVIMNVMWFVVV